MKNRVDRVVILARGASRRMGQPKGLVICPGTVAKTFVEAIAAIYDRVAVPALVVTSTDLADLYCEALTEVKSCRVVGFPAGGRTGSSLWYGWRELEAEATHVWAHPVDMPLVKLATLASLRTESIRNPESVVRPTQSGVPGHPVLFPIEFFRKMNVHPAVSTAPMRELIAMAFQLGHIEEPLLLPTEDRGVVKDFDCPADLERFD